MTTSEKLPSIVTANQNLPLIFGTVEDMMQQRHDAMQLRQDAKPAQKKTQKPQKNRENRQKSTKIHKKPIKNPLYINLPKTLKNS
jgi:hypothetical protein